MPPEQVLPTGSPISHLHASVQTDPGKTPISAQHTLAYSLVKPTLLNMAHELLRDLACAALNFPTGTHGKSPHTSGAFLVHSFT